ncbi:MAG: hypothetical protein ACRC7O_11010 [Fimbriiglobus sp.]
MPHPSADLPPDVLAAAAELAAAGRLESFLAELHARIEVARVVGEFARAELGPVARSATGLLRSAARVHEHTTEDGAVHVRRTVAAG